MDTLKGRFEKGKWIDEPLGGKGQADNQIEQRANEVSAQVSRTIADLIDFTRDLLTTEEGNSLLRRTIVKAPQILNDIVLDIVNQPEQPPDENNSADTSGAPKKI